MTDERHILVMDDGTEWLRDPRFDSEQRLKDMPEEMADQFRKELPIHVFSEQAGFNMAVVHVFMDELIEDWDGSDVDPESRWLIPLQVHFHHGSVTSVTMVHLHGIAVHQGEDDIQQVDDPEFADDLDLLTRLYEPDHPYQSAMLANGREYVVYGVPYC